MRRRASRRASGAVLAALLAASCQTMAYEETEYRVLETEGAFELRQYEPHVVAETLVSGEFDDVGNEGFRRLVAYIGGENSAKTSISMTAPVTQEPASQKIEMTAPVTQEAVDGRFRITFLMPSEYGLDELPEPLDERVRLVEMPGRRVAALRYSGTWSERRYREREVRLRAWIAQRGLEPDGEPVWARYNPPFWPWFLRRNEILIPVRTDGR